MRYKSARRLTGSDFARAVTSNRFAIVRLGSGFQLRFPEPILSHFDQSYPGQFFFGLLDKARIRDAYWWEEHFRTRYGPLKRGSREPAPGYYLFEDGAVEGHVNPPAYLDPRQANKQVIEAFERKVAARAWQDTPRTARDDDARTPVIEEPGSRPVAEPYEVLGVEPDASDDEVRRAYREQMKQNHPDRVAHLSPAIRKVAEEQTKTIQQAWETIRARRDL